MRRGLTPGRNRSKDRPLQRRASPGQAHPYKPFRKTNVRAALRRLEVAAEFAEGWQDDKFTGSRDDDFML
jgi:hypothetical protein